MRALKCWVLGSLGVVVPGFGFAVCHLSNWVPLFQFTWSTNNVWYLQQTRSLYFYFFAPFHFIISCFVFVFPLSTLKLRQVFDFIKFLIKCLSMKTCGARFYFLIYFVCTIFPFSSLSFVIFWFLCILCFASNSSAWLIKLIIVDNWWRMIATHY